jgi:hypothetical protein
VDQRDKHLTEIRDLVTTGRYVVDPLAVADAIVRRGGWSALTREPGAKSSDTCDGPGNGRVRRIIRRSRRPGRALAA